jgi:hypothetical protein
VNPGSIVRIALGTALVAAAIIVGFRWAIPQLVLPNLWPVLFAFPAIILMLVVQLAVLTLIPPSATIRADKIIIQHGQSATIIESGVVTAIYLIVHRNDRIRLRICYTRKSKARSRVIGVPPTIDLARLSEMLPLWPVVRDARERHFASPDPWSKGVHTVERMTSGVKGVQPPLTRRLI